MKPSLPETISFLPDVGPMEYFPYAEWRSALTYAGGKGGGSLHNYTHPAGDLQLREAIAGHLRVTRGIAAEASNIVLFSGSMQGIVLLVQLLVNKGDPVIIENPGYHGIHRAVQACGGMILPADVDASGIIPQDWKAQMLFVTPSRQYPTGVVLSLGRRRQLLAWAEKNAAVIVEDDYDSEFRWGGRPIEPLKALDSGNRVIYLGSFSKTMFAGLRLGYAVLPSSLVEPVVCAKALYDPFSTGVLEQRALAHFMSRGHYGRHLRRMTRIFGARYDILCSLMTKHVPELFTLVPSDAGLHIYAIWRQSPQQFTDFVSAAKARGVEFRDASLYELESSLPAACFGFAHLDENTLTEGVLRLVKAWKDVQKQSGQSIMNRE
jgi:GntR family transcriptional regulator/MocR family aminotransferase